MAATQKGSLTQNGPQYLFLVEFFYLEQREPLLCSDYNSAGEY